MGHRRYILAISRRRAESVLGFSPSPPRLSRNSRLLNWLLRSANYGRNCPVWLKCRSPRIRTCIPRIRWTSMWLFRVRFMSNSITALRFGSKRETASCRTERAMPGAIGPKRTASLPLRWSERSVPGEINSHAVLTLRTSSIACAGRNNFKAKPLLLFVKKDRRRNRSRGMNSTIGFIVARHTFATWEFKKAIGRDLDA